MRRITKIVVILLLCGAGLGAAMVLRPRPTGTMLATIPGSILAGAPHGDDVIVAAGTAGVYRVDGESGSVTCLFRFDDHEIVDLVMHDGLVYALARSRSGGRNQLHTIDPATAKLTRSLALGRAVTDLAGLLPGGVLGVVEGSQVRFIDAESGQTSGTIAVSDGVLGGGSIVDQMVYAAQSFKAGLVVMDASSREVVRTIPTAENLSAVDADVRTAYVVSRSGTRGIIDLAAGAQRPHDVMDVLVAGRGRVFALDAGAIRRLDPGGEPAETRRLPPILRDALDERPGTLISVTDKRAFVAIDDAVYRVDWPK